MKIGNTVKPSFNQFRKGFLLHVEEIIGKAVDPYDLWSEVADIETREKIIKEFIRSNEQEYGFEIVLKSSINETKGSVEGVVGELYHVFSTMFLVEVINSKLRSGERQVEV